MVKKKTKKTTKHISSNQTHILLKKSLGLYAILVFVLFILLSISAFTVHQYATARTSAVRLHRIQAIYQNLNLDSSYRPVESNLFGDKRVYSWDKSRSASSSIEYGHNDTSANTRTDLAKKIEAAGFTKIGSIYEGSISPQDHYKDGAGEYIRVSVLSKAWKDSMTYGVPTQEELYKLDPSSAPVYVTIKVNLDDNNE
jgi:hypothetical protein